MVPGPLVNKEKSQGHRSAKRPTGLVLLPYSFPKEVLQDMQRGNWASPFLSFRAFNTCNLRKYTLLKGRNEEWDDFPLWREISFPLEKKRSFKAFAKDGTK